MTRAEAYINDAMSRRGRKKGGCYCNRLRIVHKAMKEHGDIDFDEAQLSKILNTVAEKFWDKVYAGYGVAVPRLFNIEIIRNTCNWTRAVDWKRTLALWKDDEGAFDERLLVRHRPRRFIAKIRRSTINYRDRWYYANLLEFHVNKQRLKEIEDKYELR